MSRSLQLGSSTLLPKRVQLYDVAVAAATPFLAFWIRDDSFFSEERLTVVLLYGGIALASSLVSLMYFRVGDIITTYFSAYDAVKIFKTAAAAVTLSAALGFAVTRLDAVPRSLPFIHFMLLAGGLAAGRFVLSYYWHHRPVAHVDGHAVKEKDTILVVGANRMAWFYIRMVDTFSQGTQRVAGLLDTSAKAQGRLLAGHSIIGRPQQLGAIIDEYAVHGVKITKVMIAGAEGHYLRRSWPLIAEECARRNISLGSISDQLGLLLSPDAANEIGADTTLLETNEALIDRRPVWLVKRAIDLLCVALLAVALVPVAIVVALLIALESGYPVVFWQERIGRGGQALFIYKFRTLGSAFDAQGNKKSDEERLTRLGRFLRRTRLDEIPQLYNIFIGDMSLIGPRPLLPIDQPAGSAIRLSVRPGITGWAQIHGGKLIGPEEKNALDQWYVRHVSIWLDLKILFHTVAIIFRGDVLNERAIKAAMSEFDNQATRLAPGE